MSIEIDAGVGVPHAAFTVADIEPGAGAEPDPAEGWVMIFATLTGVLAASTLGVLVYLG
jgi:hypothetical protein